MINRRYLSKEFLRKNYSAVSKLCRNNFNNLGEDSATINVNIISDNINISKLKAYSAPAVKQFIFRPQNFKQFIGQDAKKQEMQLAIEKIRQGIKTHFFLDALPGSGKTTAAHIIKNELSAYMQEFIGSQINPDTLVDICNNFIDSKSQYKILFIDEIDTLSNDVCKLLNTMLEDFKLGGKQIPAFVFIGATINKDFLIKRGNVDTLDRITDHIKFDRYTAQNIYDILIQFHSNLYADKVIKVADLYVIANNCKYTPRIAISMLESYIVLKDVTKLLKIKHVVLDGLDATDIKILTTLKTRLPKTLGASALAQNCGLSEQKYITQYEPYLVEFGYIERVPQRKISAKGIAILEQII